VADNKVYVKESAIADPGPLGLACFALTTFCLSMINAGLVVAESVYVVIALALVYGGTAQVLAGMWEFKKNNVFGATAFTSYGAFWVSLGIFELLAIQKVCSYRRRAPGCFFWPGQFLPLICGLEVLEPIKL